VDHQVASGKGNCLQQLIILNGIVCSLITCLLSQLYNTCCARSKRIKDLVHGRIAPPTAPNKAPASSSSILTSVTGCTSRDRPSRPFDKMRQYQRAQPFASFKQLVIINNHRCIESTRRNDTLDEPSKVQRVAAEPPVETQSTMTTIQHPSQALSKILLLQEY
jgi:hypothetical protein